MIILIKDGYSHFKKAIKVLPKESLDVLELLFKTTFHFLIHFIFENEKNQEVVYVHKHKFQFDDGYDLG